MATVAGAVSGALLVVLTGLYFIRSTWFIFSGTLSPLTPVAALVTGLCLLVFHRPPTVGGLWFYTVCLLCAGGAAVNGALLFSTAPAYAAPAAQAFSWASIAAWLLLAGAQLARLAAASAA